MDRAIRWSLAAFLFLWTGVAFAQPPGGGPFDVLDRNKDGRLSRDELPEAVRPAFNAIDTNKDGFISREEDAAARRRMAQGPDQPRRLPESVTREKDIPYAGTDNPRQRLDLYLPKTPKEDRPLPVIAYIHGGAWMGGDRASGGPLAGLVASGDFAGISIGYRLSTEATWPAQIHDCKAAIRWLRANARKYHLDPDRIGIIGESAGGHLVAMLGTSGDVEALEGDLGPNKGTSSRVRCVVDEFGPAELLTMGDSPSRMSHYAADSPESRLLGGAILDHKELARAASPITYVSKDDPPFLIIHGDADPLVPFSQSERLSKALRNAGVECHFIRVKDGGHGGFHNPELPRRIRQFFDRHLRGQAGTVSEEAVPNLASPPATSTSAREIPLYPGVAPGSEKWDWAERSVTTPNGLPMVQDVVRPVLLHYPADRGRSVGTAMIVAPGGGFQTLMMSYEGVDIARRLNAMGVDAFVLKYRLAYSGPDAQRSPGRRGADAKARPAEPHTGGAVGSPSAPARIRRFSVIGSHKGQAGQDLITLASDDGQQAVRLVRERADEFGVRRDRIGMIGFSAGGVVTSEAIFGPAGTRPDFAAIIYGVGDIGEVPSPAPPLFIAVAADDPMAASRSIELFSSWRKAKGPAELHVFQTGAHGFVNKGGGADHFMDRLEEWLKVNKLLSKAAN